RDRRSGSSATASRGCRRRARALRRPAASGNRGGCAWDPPRPENDGIAGRGHPRAAPDAWFAALPSTRMRSTMLRRATGIALSIAGVAWLTAVASTLQDWADYRVRGLE